MQPQNNNSLDKKPADDENPQLPSSDSQPTESSATPDTSPGRPIAVDAPQDASVNADDPLSKPVVTPLANDDAVVAAAPVPEPESLATPSTQPADQPAPQPVSSGASSVESPQAPHMPAFMTPTSAQTGSIVYGSHAGEQMVSPANGQLPSKKSKKPLFVAGLVSALVLLLGGGFVFGYYIPNKPENVWKSAMVNNGKLYDAMTEYALKDHEFKGTKIDGSYEVSGSVNSKGTLTGQTAGNNGKFNGNLTIDGKKLGFEARSIAKTETAVPDVYVRFNGLSGLSQLLGGSQAGSPQLKAFLNGVSKQWYVIGGDMLSQAQAESKADEGPNFTKEDTKQFLDKVGSISKDYLFTADEDRAVLKVKELVGKEDKAKRSTYHYKVKIDESNLSDYLKALCNGLKDDKIGKQLLQGSDDCAEFAKEARGSNDVGDIDAWVDRRTKLIHVLRLSDPEEAANYLEFTQDYQGGDEFPFSLELSAKTPQDTSKFKLSGVLNTNTNKLQLEGLIDIAAKTAKESMKGSFKLAVEPSNDTSLKVEKPANARPIMELVMSLVFMQMSAAAEQTAPAGAGSFNITSPSFDAPNPSSPTTSGLSGNGSSGTAGPAVRVR